MGKQVNQDFHNDLWKAISHLSYAGFVEDSLEEIPSLE
jgi:hypothetical protein